MYLRPVYRSRLGHYLRKLDMSKEQLAKESGVPRHLVSRFVTTTKHPSLLQALAIARALGASVEDIWIVGFEEDHEEFRA